MSKSKLKKEIAMLERSQLEQMVLDAYEARKEIKEYFEFFLNPDVDKLLERYKSDISKELVRSKWGRSKARASVIKRLVKNFEGFHPGYEKELDLLMFIVRYSLLVETKVNLTDPLINGTVAFMLKMVEIADRNFVADKVLDELISVIDNERSGTRYFRKFLRNALSDAQADLTH